VFGKKCIQKWLRKAKSCPQCVSKAKPSDVRVIYTAKVFAVDDSKHEMLVKEATRAKMERIDAERERTRVTLRLRMVNGESVASIQQLIKTELLFIETSRSQGLWSVLLLHQDDRDLHSHSLV
jgi:hypothetical protein